MDDIINRVTIIESTIVKKGEEEEKTLNLTRICSCGYDPFDKHSFFRSNTFNCNVNLAFQNHITFPSFAILTHSNSPSPIYFDITKTDRIPKRHWAFIFEINEILQTNDEKIKVLGSTYFGENMVSFFNSNKTYINFSLSDFQKGNTTAILYAEKATDTFANGYVTQDDSDLIYMFKSNIEYVFKEGNNLLKNAELKCKLDQLECFCCGKKTKNIFNCEKCNLACYCSNECQFKEWNLLHKNLCEQNQMLLRLACLPRYHFKHYYTFNLLNNPLPPYSYIKKYDQTLKQH